MAHSADPDVRLPDVSTRPWLEALLTALVGIALTIMGMIWLDQNAQAAAKMRFERYQSKIEATVQDRFNSSVGALKGLRSTFLAYGGGMDRLAFRAWVTERHVERDFPGLRGLGFIERVDRPELPRYVEREKADHAPDYTVHTTGNAPDLYIIRFIEPLANNLAAWGYDVGSERVRRTAAEQAVATGQPTLTGSIVLVQDGKKRPGFLYYLPLYRNDAPTRTPEERRKALLGLLYTPIVVDELMAGAEKITDGLVDFELFDAPPGQERQLLFDLDRHLEAPSSTQERVQRLQHQQTIVIGGRTLLIQTRTTEAFATETRNFTYLAFGAAGLTLSLLLAATLWFMSMNQTRATTLARRMTADLRASQREAENAWRGQRAMLDTLDRHSLLSVTDRHGVILEVNDAFCAISGYTRDELLGQTHRVVNSGHHEPHFWREMWDTIKEGRSWQGEICNRAKDGRLYWVSSIIAPFYGEDGQIEKFVSIRQDITRRKQLEQEAQDMAERYTLAIEGGHDGLWDWMNVHAHDEWWSPQFYRLLGYEPDEIQADLVTFDSLLHPDDQGPTFQAINRSLRSQAPFDVEYRLRTKQGEYRWFRSRAKVYVDEFGDAKRMAGSIQDVHERRLAQAQIRAHRDQMAAIFSLSPDAFVSIDQQGLVSYASPAFETLTWLPVNDIVGLSEAALIERLGSRCGHALGATRFHELIAPAPAAGHAGRSKAVLSLQAPHARSLELSVQEGTGASVSHLVHLRDVTRELELDRMKSEFMSMAAHELRTPMASIYGFTELLISRELRPEKHKELLHRIYRQSGVMVTIINELLDLARLEARQGQDFVPETCDLVNLVTGVVSDHQPPAGRTPPIMQGGDYPMWVHVDPSKLRQAVLNVLSNAFKYSPEGGTIDIAFVYPDPKDQRNGQLAGVRITDHGIGMTPEQLSRLGERFYRVDKTGKIPGTGLGVSIVREILHLMGGELQVDSVWGEGTTVTLWLPMAEISAEAEVL